MIVYTCPICGGDLRTVMIATDPPITRYECLCGWSFEEPRQNVIRVPYPADTNAWFPTSAACKNCSSNPQNGGSGICNCTLGMITVT